MSQRKLLLVVEGNHDEAFIAALLRKGHGFSAVTRLSQADPYWRATIPTTFPHDDDLRRRMPVPYFYTRADASLAIIVAVGESRLVNVVSDTLAVLGEPTVDAIGVVLDADDRRSVNERFASIREALRELQLTPGSMPGEVGASAPNCGVYVLPDNVSRGTLEDILLECAGKNYRAALEAANALVDRVDPRDYQGDDLRELNKPAGKNKARIAAITAILKPGKTTQASISDNRWLGGDVSALDSVRKFEAFLNELLTGQVRPPVILSTATQAEPADARDSPLVTEASEREGAGGTGEPTERS